MQISIKDIYAILKQRKLLKQQRKDIIARYLYQEWGGNYSDNVDGISYAYVCVHRGNIKASYDTITGAAYIDWYYRIVNGVVEIWVSPKNQYPNFISILVMRNAYGNWNVGNLEHSLDLPSDLVDF